MTKKSNELLAEAVSKINPDNELPDQTEIDACRKFWEHEQKHPTLKTGIPEFPDVALSILNDVEQIINTVKANRP